MDVDLLINIHRNALLFTKSTSEYLSELNVIRNSKLPALLCLLYYYLQYSRNKEVIQISNDKYIKKILVSVAHTKMTILGKQRQKGDEFKQAEDNMRPFQNPERKGKDSQSKVETHRKRKQRKRDRDRGRGRKEEEKEEEEEELGGEEELC